MFRSLTSVIFLTTALGIGGTAQASITDVEAGTLIRLANERIAAGDTPAEVEAWLAGHMNAPAPLASTHPQPWDVYASAAARSDSPLSPAAPMVDVWGPRTAPDATP